MGEKASGIEVRVTIEDLGEARGELKRHLSPRTVEAILRSLPLEGRTALLKGEVYFKVSLDVGVEKAKRDVDKGMMAYWPLGSALCFFTEPCRPYSPVNVIGEVKENLELLRTVREGMKMRIERV